MKSYGDDDTCPDEAPFQNTNSQSGQSTVVRNSMMNSKGFATQKLQKQQQFKLSTVESKNMKKAPESKICVARGDQKEIENKKATPAANQDKQQQDEELLSVEKESQPQANETLVQWTIQEDFDEKL